MNKISTPYNFTLFLPFLLFILCFTQNYKLVASDIRGAEIQWKHISSEQFEISLNYFRDCNGLAASSNKTIKIFCGRGKATDTVFLQLNRSSFQDISPACLTNTEPCGNLGNTDSGGVGLEKHVYKATIDFSMGMLKAMKDSGVCAFRFYFEEAQRSSGITTGAANSVFVIDAEIELCNLQNSIRPIGDNSPQYRNNPIVDRCCNQPVYYNEGIVDIDGDSLAFSMVTALMGIDSLTSFASPHNPTTWPMTGYCQSISPCSCRTNRKPIQGFCFDPMTADYMFHPINCSQSGILVFKVDQYRLDTLAKQWLYIGFTKREIQLRIKNCGNNNPPILKDISNPTICEGKEICMTIVAEDEEFAGSSGVQPWKDTIDLTWNNGIPEANFKVGDPYFTFTNGVTVAVREVEICWQTKEGDGREAPYIFAVTARDRVCPMNAISSRAYVVKVKRAPKIKSNVSFGVCGRTIVKIDYDSFFVKNNYSLNWTISDTTQKVLFTSKNPNDSTSLKRGGPYFLKINATSSYNNCSVLVQDTIYLESEDTLWNIIKSDIEIITLSSQCLKGNLFEFKDNSQVDVGFISNTKWEFGDGDSAYGENVIKSYDEPGLYDITLITQSDLGCESRLEKQIKVFEMPISKFITSDSIACQKKQTIEFIDSSIGNDAPINQWKWVFSDGDSIMNRNTKKMFSIIGENVAYLVVTDSNSCSDTSDIFKFTILPMAIAKIETSPTKPYCVGNEVVFKSNSIIDSGHIINSVRWLINEVETDSGETITRQYSEAKNNSVKLIVGTGHICFDTSIFLFSINEIPIASFDKPKSSLCESTSFEYKNNSTVKNGSIKTSHWYFGDNDNSNEHSPKKSYNNAGDYIVTLIVTSDSFCSDTIKESVNVLPSPTAKIYVNDSIQCINGNLFTITDSSTINIGEIVWNRLTVGNTQINNFIEFNISYTSPGRYMFLLQNLSNNSCSSSDSLYIEVLSAPIAIGITGSSFVKQGDSTTYELVGDGIDSVFWKTSFSKILSGQNSNEINVLWTDTGWQSVSYIVSNQYGCKDSASMEVYVGDSSTLSVKFLSDVFGIHIYPNPAKNLLQIESQKELVKLIVIDSKGAMILTQDFTETLDVSHLKSGIYILQLYDLEGKIFTHKFVKE